MSIELSAIRTKLRAVNVEYSALVRATPTRARSARLKDLRGERQALIALMARAPANPSSARSQQISVAIQGRGAGAYRMLRRLLTAFTRYTPQFPERTEVTGR